MVLARIENDLRQRRIGYRFKMKKRGKLLHEGKVIDCVTLKHKHGKYVIVMERLGFSKGSSKGAQELRLCYWDGRKFGQYATILPEQELRQILLKAKRQGVLSSRFSID